MVFYGMAATFEPGDVVLTSESEYASNYIAYLQVARRTGAQIRVAPSTGPGEGVDVQRLEELIDERVKLIGITHVPTQSGLVNPAREVGQVARRHGIPFLLDACQSVGQMPIDVGAIGCDFLSATGRKYLRGPRGTGFLFVRRERLGLFEPAFLDLHAATWSEADAYVVRPDARRFETWESNVAGQLGLGAAVEYALEIGLDAIYARISYLAGELRARLEGIPDLRVTDAGRERCGIVTFAHARHEPEVVRLRLAERGIQVSTSPRQAALLDMGGRGLAAVSRASVHYYNSEDELDRLLEALASM
jgi:cysteine desulfurase/selenocysteine lyase